MLNLFEEEINKLKIIELNQKDLIGGGANAQVYHYSLKNTAVAVKCFKKKEIAMLEKQNYEDIQNLMPNFPGIVNFYGMKELKIIVKGVFNDEYIGYAIFLSVCEIDLSKVIGQIQLPVKEIFNMWSQLIIPLIFLHRNGCFHGDIKPANILVKQMIKNQQRCYVYYFGDFGEGKYAGIDIATNYDTLSIRGTPNYLSPELWEIYSKKLEKGHFNPLKADIYALGIVILQQFVQSDQILQLINKRDNKQNYLAQQKKIEAELLNKAELKNLKDVVQTIVRMVNFGPKERPSALEIGLALILSKQLVIDNIPANNLQVLIEWLFLGLRCIFQFIRIICKAEKNQNNQMQQLSAKEETLNFKETIEKLKNSLREKDLQIQELQNKLQKLEFESKTTAETEYEKGIEFKKNQQWKKAVESICVQIDCKHKNGWFYKGFCEDKLNEYENAIKSYDKALQIDSKNSNAWNNKGSALDNLGKYETAIECYDKALQIDSKDSITWNNKGFALDNQGKHETAIECYDKALQIDSKNSNAWNNKGLALKKLGKYETAIECYNQAIAIQPTSVRYYNLGCAYESFGKKREAYESFKNCWKLNSSYKDVEQKIAALEKEIN